jgi:pyrimidine deaminase RibD-like protein
VQLKINFTFTTCAGPPSPAKVAYHSPINMPLETWSGGNTPPPQHADPSDHATYMRLALDQAHESPPKPSNFRVGALLVDADTGVILSRGYTLELEGNTHAEQCCLMKIAQSHSLPEERVGEVLPANTVIYTTMEPCNLRLSGNLPCADRIINTKGKDGKGAIKRVYLGVKEPEKFVSENQGRSKLEMNGVECIHVPGLEEDILRVATAGHGK